LERLGFKRYKCRKCGVTFWSKVPRETCGDAPCEKYRFMEIPAKRFGYDESRKLFLEFFERNGHKVLAPRPVVARWREDLYLTIASIVLFQPHVTSGLVPPPANPLVVAQPCIRLEDIDNVGLTMGRHLTNFIMGGHHAFNYPDKHVYWIDETAEYAFKFFTEYVGIPPEELTFKESWWEGGGNAGPAFEVCAGGLELATLVFMKYEVKDGKYVEMPIKVVDTGYGIERIAWIASKEPTAFHAVYGDLLHKFFDELGVEEPEPKILTAALVEGYSAGSVDELAAAVSRATGASVESVRDVLSKAIEVFSLLDLTKTIALMLSDGVVPSNTGEGYLARLVIRRALRKLKLLGARIDLASLVLMQVDKWSYMYPRMSRMKSYISDVLAVEERKFEEILKAIPSIAKRFARRKPSVDELVELYDSRGIPPDVLAEYLKKTFGIEIEVPRDFYSLVAKRHSRTPLAKLVEKSKLPKEVVDWASRYPPTRMMFHENQYMRSFTARVLGINRNYLILDATAFYPEGGGQLGDKGRICINGDCASVVDTQKVGSVVVHVLDRPLSANEGDFARGEIDWDRRYRLMRHHTATHLLLGALRRILGEHVWQAGAEKTESRARLDVTHYKTPTKDEIDKVEKLVNEIISQRLEVRTSIMDRNEAEEKYGFVLYQGGVPASPKIRVVEIPGWDVEACFGTHVSNVSEVGAFKIVRVEKIADGVVRFEYVAGPAVVDYARSLEDSLSTVSKALGARPSEIVVRAVAISRELKELSEKLKEYRRILKEMAIRDIVSSATRIGSVQLSKYVQSIEDMQLLREIAREATSQRSDLILIAVMPKEDGSFIEISLGREAAKVIDARSILSKLAKIINARGGGKRDHVTAVARVPPSEVIKALDSVIKELT